MSEQEKWLSETPQCVYELSSNYHGDVDDNIDLTYEEYVGLKKALAQMRGMALPEEHNGKPWPGNGGGASTISSQQQTEEKPEFSEGMVATLREICAAHRGDNSPAENFICQLVLAYKVRKGGLTPDEAAEDLETFRDNFADNVEIARDLLRKHPDLVNGTSASRCTDPILIWIPDNWDHLSGENATKGLR